MRSRTTDDTHRGVRVQAHAYTMWCRCAGTADVKTARQKVVGIEKREKVIDMIGTMCVCAPS
uniref:Uncharacterized protein n=1 Tax=Oryza brachyantha TaxID=4533 RepID=J3M5F4_ORYBR